MLKRCYAQKLKKIELEINEDNFMISEYIKQPFNEAQTLLMCKYAYALRKSEVGIILENSTLMFCDRR